MIEPTIWEDHYVAELSRDERLLLLGCVSNADDEGRLRGHPAYLKAAIFMYDADLTPEKIEELRQCCLNKMQAWPKSHPLLLLPYENSNQEYLVFPNWLDIQKPSHPSKSKLPAPPLETLPIFSREPTEPLTKGSREIPSQSRSGQSSLGQFSLGQVSVVQEDFTKYLDSEKDLTDFLTMTLTKYMPRGPIWAVEVLCKLWQQCVGQEMNQAVFELTNKVVKEYPVPVLAGSYVKAVKYRGGKRGSPKYLDKILKEQAAKESNKGPPP
jgi:hypothetical protein